MDETIRTALIAWTAIALLGAVLSITTAYLVIRAAVKAGVAAALRERDQECRD